MVETLQGVFTRDDYMALPLRQRRFLEAFIELTEDQRRTPSYRDLMAAMELKSPNGVACHIRPLLKKGWLERLGDDSRNVTLSERAMAYFRRVWCRYGKVYLKCYTPMVELTPEEARDLADKLLNAARKCECGGEDDLECYT